MCEPDENVQYIKRILFNDPNSMELEDSFIKSLLETNSFNTVILTLATSMLEDLEVNPTKYSEVGGITVEMGNVGLRLKSIIKLAESNRYAPIVAIENSNSNNYVTGVLNIMKECEFNDFNN